MAVEITDLDRLPPDADTVFGGKAAGLARLLRAGARVPRGFAVSATTSRPGQWPTERRTHLLARAEDLVAEGAVAVRSSALGEDATDRSFAGLLTTSLDVRTAVTAMAAASECIDSGGAPRVTSYAGRTEPLPVGVVIQRMVEPRCAGVCFTQDPTGRDHGIVVEAVSGRGDSLVSGTSEPERWRAYASGTGAWECRCELGRGVLDEELVERIAAEARELASHLEPALDLEWAVDHQDTLWWLQGRPITALVRPLEIVVQRLVADADDGSVTVWSNWNVRETMPDPLYPLTWTVWRDEILPVVTRHLFGAAAGSQLEHHMVSLDLIHGRLYFNINAMLAAPVVGTRFLAMLEVMDARAAVTLERLVNEGVLRPRLLPGAPAVRALRVMVASLRGLFRLTAALRPRRALRVLDEDAAAVARRAPIEDMSSPQLLDEMRLWSRPECQRLLFGLQMEAMAALVYAVARRLFRDHPGAREMLATGIPANPTTAISLAVDDLVARAGPVAEAFAEPGSIDELERRLLDLPGGRSWLSSLSGFLDRFGHRGPMEFDLAASRWVEDPTMIIELVRSSLHSPASETVADRMARLSRRRQELIASAVAASSWWRRPLMRWLALLVEAYMPLREAPKHYGLRVFQRMRQAALELGRRLVASGVLSSADDVFLLEWPELADHQSRGFEGPPTLDERRRLMERFRRERPPEILRSDDVPVEVSAAGSIDGDATLRGTAVSAGRATGPARVLTSPDPRRIREGDVLVMEFADPGWTPLFPRAAAVVMEVGGLMCHAAVVAREMGVPAVFGVEGATSALHDGDRVMVDGTEGTVTLLDPPTPPA